MLQWNWLQGFWNDGTLAAAQLHGQEDETYIRELKQLSDKPIIKAFFCKKQQKILQKAVQSPADYILLDQGSGGTGKTFDWSLIPEIERPIFSCRGNRCFEYETGDL